MFLILGYLLIVILPYLIWKYLPINQLSLRNKCILITGAGSGIGRKMAIFAATRRHANLILLDLRIDSIKRVKKEIEDMILDQKLPRVTIEVHQCDVSNEDAVDEVIDSLHQEVDILINNAGIVIGKDVIDTEPREFRKVLEVNVLGPFLMIRKILPMMRERGQGHVTNIASVMGHCGSARLAEYCASKFALVGFHDSLRMELQRDGFSQNQIGTTLICPSAIDTGMFEGLKVSWLMNIVAPVLRENDVAERVLRGIERREYVVYMPALTALCFPVMRLCPTPLKDIFTRLLGGTTGMDDDFKGRGVKHALGEDVAEKSKGRNKGGAATKESKKKV